MFVQLRPAAAAAKRRAIGIDIGGTKIAAGVVTEAGTIIRALTVPTPQRQDQIVEGIAAAVADLRRAHPDVAAVGIGAAGMVDWPSGHIRWAPNNAYSTGPRDARGGEGHLRLTVQSYDDDKIVLEGAIAAATTAFNAFTDHARGFDGCSAPAPMPQKERASMRQARSSDT